jgi:DNA polymerase/3'-5' exonuclease PolX
MGDPVNQAVASKLREMADVLAEQQADRFRIPAYRRAANAVESLDRPIQLLRPMETDGSSLVSVSKGRIARKIRGFSHVS